MIDKIKRKLLFSIGLGALVFLALSLYADLDNLKQAFEHFRVAYVIPALFLALGNYSLRFARWQFYLRRLDVPLRAGESLVVFLAGLILSVTPGKAGELVKSYFIKARLNLPISRSAPAVLCERLTDLFALIFLGLIGVSTFREGLFTLLCGGAFLLLVVLLLGRPGVMAVVLRLVERLPGVGRLAGALRAAFSGLQVLITPPALAWGVTLGGIAWFFECLGFYCILKGFGTHVTVIPAMFIYAFATLFGAVTMLPGGLGTTEASMTGLLALQGVARPDAVGATMLIRLCTLWFAVAIGAYVLLRYRRYFEWDMEPDPPQSVQKNEPSTVKRSVL